VEIPTLLRANRLFDAFKNGLILWGVVQTAVGGHQ